MIYYYYCRIQTKIAVLDDGVQGALLAPLRSFRDDVS